MGLAPDAELPATVILVARADAATPPDVLLARLWRTLFHARVHVIMERRFADHAITEAGLRARIGAIGPAEFEEIRMVLQEDHYLLPPRDDRSAVE